MLTQITGLMLHKIWFGIALAAVPGPITFEMIRQGTTKSSLHAFAVRIGANISTFIILLLTLYAIYLGRDLQDQTFRLISATLGAIGSSLLILKGIHQLYKPKTWRESTTSPPISAILSGISCGIANPIVLLFWIAIFENSFLVESTHILTLFNQGVLIILGMTLWGITLSMIIHYSKNNLPQRFLKTIGYLSGAALLIIGVIMLNQTINTLNCI